MDGRTRNAQRSKAALLDAALTEFADRGLAGARVAEIARRAGVNKQLINYHFGGKQGLYNAVFKQWQEQEQQMREAADSLDDLAAQYVDMVAADPRWPRFTARAVLDSDGPLAPEDDSELDDLRDRQRRGELAAEFDPAAVILAITGMVAAPVLYRHVPDGYADQVRRIVRRLRA